MLLKKIDAFPFLIVRCYYSYFLHYMNRIYKNIFINNDERSHLFIYKNVFPALLVDVILAARLSIFFIIKSIIYVYHRK